MKKSIRQPKTFKFIGRNGAVGVLQSANYSSDRYYMSIFIKSTIKFLDEHKILEYYDFVPFLRGLGFKSDHLHDFISEFIKLINNDQNLNHVDWIKPRELKKSNDSEKNLILNRLSFQYQKEIVLFFHNYLNNNFPNLENTKNLEEAFSNNIDRFLNQTAISTEKNSSSRIDNEISSLFIEESLPPLVGFNQKLFDFPNCEPNDLNSTKTSEDFPDADLDNFSEDFLDYY